MSKDVLLNSDRKLCGVVTYVKQIITFIRGSQKRSNRLSVILNASSKSHSEELCVDLTNSDEDTVDNSEFVLILGSFTRFLVL